LEKRRDEWITEIANRIIELEKQFKGFKVTRLAENEAFITNCL